MYKYFRIPKTSEIQNPADISLTLSSDNPTDIFLGLVILPRACSTELCISLIARSHPSLPSLSARSGGGQVAAARYFSRSPCSSLVCPRFHAVLSPGLGKEVANSAGGTLHSGFCSWFVYHCSLFPQLCTLSGFYSCTEQVVHSLFSIHSLFFSFENSCAIHFQTIKLYSSLRRNNESS